MVEVLLVLVVVLLALVLWHLMKLRSRVEVVVSLLDEAALGASRIASSLRFNAEDEDQLSEADRMQLARAVAAIRHANEALTRIEQRDLVVAGDLKASRDRADNVASAGGEPGSAADAGLTSDTQRAAEET